MKYKCLVLDHDDTIVSSTAEIHYPAFIEYLKLTRPTAWQSWTLEEYLNKNFHPGILPLLRDELGMDEAELDRELVFWSNFVEAHTPTAFPGISEIISEFRARGGIVAVDSHSLMKYIKRDFEFNELPEPDIIYSWDLPEEQRKPSPYTVLRLIENYNLKPSEVLVVDDLKPGYDMARGAGADFAAAGWAYNVPEIEAFMRKHCDYYLRSVDELRKILFE